MLRSIYNEIYLKQNIFIIGLIYKGNIYKKKYKYKGDIYIEK